jgi:wyosine [tRNA(Phe)-imidazoG37] synthetase (radical SAM superfamily)
MKTVYGPVPSWRLGRSLGIDVICSEKKVCSFDCIYCQLGKTKIRTLDRQQFIELERLEQDLYNYLLEISADIFTLSGSGEPTLASNLVEVIELLRTFTELPLGILTNSSLITDPKVRKELYQLDVVVAKLDAKDQRTFELINQPLEGIKIDQIIDGLKKFRNNFQGKLAIQLMFVQENKGTAKDLAAVVSEIRPDEVQINTPLRPCNVPPLSESEINEIETHFQELNFESVYSSKKPEVKIVDENEMLFRRKMRDTI